MNLKKSILSAIMALSAALLPGQGVAQTGAQIVSGIAQGDKLNVRSGPGANYQDVGDLFEGEIVFVQRLDNSGRWAQIKFRGGPAWVATRYLEDAMNPDDSSSQTGPNVVIGIAQDDSDGGLVVREGPGMRHARLAVLRNGTQVHVVQFSDNYRWAMIERGNDIGWVAARYLRPVPQQAPDESHTLNGFPLGLSCHGTEPFWTFEVADDRTVTYTSLNDGQAPLASLAQVFPAAGGGFPYGFAAGVYQGELSQQSCSDGMSDTSYSMRLILSVAGQNGNVETLYGCCNKQHAR